MSCSSRNILPLGRSVSMATRDYEVPHGGPPLRPLLADAARRRGCWRKAKSSRSTNRRINQQADKLTDEPRCHSLIRLRYDKINSRFTERAPMANAPARTAIRDDSRARTHVNVVSSDERTCVSSGRDSLPRVNSRMWRRRRRRQRRRRWRRRDDNASSRGRADGCSDRGWMDGCGASDPAALSEAADYCRYPRMRAHNASKDPLDAMPERKQIMLLLCCCCRQKTHDRNKLTATSLVRLDALSAGVAGTIYSRQYPSHTKRGEAGKDSRTKRQNTRIVVLRVVSLRSRPIALLPSSDFYSVFYPL